MLLKSWRDSTRILLGFFKIYKDFALIYRGKQVKRPEQTIFLHILQGERGVGVGGKGPPSLLPFLPPEGHTKHFRGGRAEVAFAEQKNGFGIYVMITIKWSWGRTLFFKLGSLPSPHSRATGRFFQTVPSSHIGRGTIRRRF